MAVSSQIHKIYLFVSTRIHVQYIVKFLFPVTVYSSINVCMFQLAQFQRKKKKKKHGSQNGSETTGVEDTSGFTGAASDQGASYIKTDASQIVPVCQDRT